VFNDQIGFIKRGVEQLNLKIIEFQKKQEEQIGKIENTVIQKSGEIMELVAVCNEQKEMHFWIKQKKKESPSDHSLSSNSDKDPNNFEDIIMKRASKRRKLIHSSTETSKFEAEELKRILIESKNEMEFKETLKKKGSEFTIVHNMERTRNEGIENLRIRTEKGCIPVSIRVQCPYCKVNYYGNSEEEFEEMLSKRMEGKHDIFNKNSEINILFNLYGMNW
jgi:hypothetical protein